MTRREGTDEEFGRFVVAAYPGLVRFGALLVGERAGGEDLTQTALLKVYRAWPRIEDERAAGAYTRRVMVRVAQRSRRRHWTGEVPTALDPDAVVTLDRTDDLAVADLVRRALLGLPLAQRAVLVLRYFEMWSEAETADALDIPVGTVKSRAARGLAALRQHGLLDRHQLAEEEVR